MMAARIQVKIDIMARLRPEKVSEFNQVRRDILGPMTRIAGTSVVRARDWLRWLRGQPSRVDELIKPIVTG